MEELVHDVIYDKPIGRIKDFAAAFINENMCPFNGSSDFYKLIWFEKEERWRCALRKLIFDHKNPCSMEDARECPLLNFTKREEK